MPVVAPAKTATRRGGSRLGIWAFDSRTWVIDTMLDAWSRRRGWVLSLLMFFGVLLACHGSWVTNADIKLTKQVNAFYIERFHRKYNQFIYLCRLMPGPSSSCDLSLGCALIRGGGGGRIADQAWCVLSYLLITLLTLKTARDRFSSYLSLNSEYYRVQPSDIL